MEVKTNDEINTLNDVYAMAWNTFKPIYRVVMTKRDHKKNI